MNISVLFIIIEAIFFIFVSAKFVKSREKNIASAEKILGEYNKRYPLTEEEYRKWTKKNQKYLKRYQKESADEIRQVYFNNDFEKNNKNRSILRKKYWKWEVVYILTYFVGGAIITASLAFINDFISQYALVKSREAVLLFSVGFIGYIIPFMFLAFLIGFAFVEYISRVYLGEKYADYQAYKELSRHALGTKREIKVLSIITLSVVFLTLIIFVNWYAVFSSNTIYINQPFSIIEKRYNYSEVKHIWVTTRQKDNDGNVTKSLLIRVGMNDGNEIRLGNFQSLEYDNSPEKDKHSAKDAELDNYKDAVDYISKKSGVLYEIREFEDDFK